ncbi:hypothetical protein D3C78_1892660 [compost metagenome]
MAEKRTSNTEVIYLKQPTIRNGISNICKVFRITTSSGVEANEEPIIRIDMISPASNSAFFPPMRFTMSGAKNMIEAFSNSPIVVT